MNNDKENPALHLVFPDDEVPPEPLPETSSPVVEIKPWVRLFARWVDETLFSFLLALLFLSLAPGFIDGMPIFIFAIIVLFFWLFVETFLLITLGTTPGKWLLKTKIRAKEDKKPGILNAFRRSIKVWFFGQAIGVPFILVFTYFCAYFELEKNKKTTWDRSEQFTITHEKIPLYRGVLAALIILIPIAVYLDQSFAKQSTYILNFPVHTTKE